MTPYYDHGGITIYHGDAHELVPQLEVGVFVTDPPYGVGKQYGQTADTVETFVRCVSLVISRGLPAAVFLAVPRIWDLPERPQWLAVWSKRYGASGLIAYPIYPHWEAIALYSIRGNFAGNNGHRSDVFTFAPAKAAGSGHPTPKPLDLMKELIGWMPAGGIVCDPFMGSGTTLVAAKAIGRHAVGVELEERNCELAAKRLSQEVLDFA